MSGSFPPTGPVTLPTLDMRAKGGPQFASYPYQEYNDDINIVAFFYAYNQVANAYLQFFNNLNLPIYTQLSGPLLDWVAEGLYGISRPTLPFGSIQSSGPYATVPYATIPYASGMTTGDITNYVITDDLFKRIITWFFFKGDGLAFTILWLKRRVKRFLIGTGGTAPNIDQTNEISVQFPSSNLVTITVTLNPGTQIALSTAQVLQAAIADGAVSLPFQFQFSLVIVNNLANTGLSNVANVLNVTTTMGWPTSSSGLAAGSVYLTGSVAHVVAGITPNPAAAPLLFGTVTSAQLLALGGGNLPTSDPVNVNQLWNNAGTINVSTGIV